MTLVGEPVPYTVSSLMDPSAFLGDQGVAAQPIPNISALECGARVDDGAVDATGRRSSVVESATLYAPARTRFDSGTAIDLTLVPRALSARESVAYPSTMRVWFLAHPPGTAEDLNASEPWYVVVGTAAATVNRGEPIVLDRFTGPSATSVAFADVSWCDDGGSQSNTLVVFEGTERADDGTGASEATILDAWSTDFATWAALRGDN